VTTTNIDRLARYRPEAMPDVPEHLRDGLSLYIVHGYQPGHFLTAVLEYNLFEAMARGDRASLAGLHGLVSWIYNRAPFDCHGSPAKVTAWLKSGGLEEVAHG